MINKLIFSLTVMCVSLTSLKSQEQAYVDYYDTDETIKRAEGKYVRGIEHGLWRTYYQNGNIQEEINYFMGKLEGEFKRHHENGNLSVEQHFKNSKLDSISYSYFLGGEKMSEGSYSDNRKSGKWKYLQLYMNR